MFILLTVVYMINIKIILSEPVHAPITLPIRIHSNHLHREVGFISDGITALYLKTPGFESRHSIHGPCILWVLEPLNKTISINAKTTQ